MKQNTEWVEEKNSQKNCLYKQQLIKCHCLYFKIINLVKFNNYFFL
jgi:hypothetical protein